MKKIYSFLVCTMFVLCLTASNTWADSVSTFGTLSGATFNGTNISSGIPNNAVAITTITDGANIITLGLTATQRYANPALTNNGAGVFTARAGGDILDGFPTYAVWNFDYYVSSTGGNYTFDLLYDFDPATGTLQSSLGRVTSASPANGAAVLSQDSWNLGMSFLSTGVFGAAPAFSPFNPNALGEYSFALIAKKSGLEIGRSSIVVNSVAVPEPSTLLLLASGLIGIVGAARRRKAA